MARNTGKVTVQVNAERDNLDVYLLAANGDTLAEWHDDDARQMIEDGFFDPRHMVSSVLAYASHIGILTPNGQPRRARAKRSGAATSAFDKRARAKNAARRSGGDNLPMIVPVSRSGVGQSRQLSAWRDGSHRTAAATINAAARQFGAAGALLANGDYKLVYVQGGKLRSKTWRRVSVTWTA